MTFDTILWHVSMLAKLPWRHCPVRWCFHGGSVCFLHTAYCLNVKVFQPMHLSYGWWQLHPWPLRLPTFTRFHCGWIRLSLALGPSGSLQWGRQTGSGSALTLKQTKAWGETACPHPTAAAVDSLSLYLTISPSHTHTVTILSTHSLSHTHPPTPAFTPPAETQVSVLLGALSFVHIFRFILLSFLCADRCK